MNPKVITSSMNILKSFSSKLLTHICFDITKDIMFRNSNEIINTKKIKKKLILFIII